LREQVPWPRILLEGVVIVGSILLAFGIEAWWDAAQDREVERAHLVALDSDLTESIRLMAVSDTGFAQIRSSLLRLAEADVLAQPADSLARWARAGLWSLREYEPQLSSLADLEASDQLGLLAPPVRRQVSTVKRALEEVSTRQLNMRTIQERLFDPLLMDELPIGSALALSLDGAATLPPLEASGWAPLGSPSWRNRVVAKLLAQQNTGLSRGELREEMQLLQSLVRDRLAELN
jgi:hypothetical protein